MRIATIILRKFTAAMESLQSEMINTFLNLERLDANLFRANHLIPGIPDVPRVYGGQVVGQALVAASKTVKSDYHAHSLHSYFILGANRSIPIIYNVERVRDGKSFCTRSVKGIQDGNNIFVCEISFQKDEPEWISHQKSMPDVPAPETLKNINDLIADETYQSDSEETLKKSRRMHHIPMAFDVRPVEPDKYLRRGKMDPTYMCWVKAKESLGDDSRLHMCSAAFFSDSCMVHTALIPHAHKLCNLSMAVSLDHSMWFHDKQFRMDNWMLYETECMVASGSRALIHGRLWTQNGTLVVTTAQEALIRGLKNNI